MVVLQSSTCLYSGWAGGWPHLCYKLYSIIGLYYILYYVLSNSLVYLSFFSGIMSMSVQLWPRALPPSSLDSFCNPLPSLLLWVLGRLTIIIYKTFACETNALPSTTTLIIICRRYGYTDRTQQKDCICNE